MKQEAKSRVDSLNISQSVVWIHPVPKNQLIKYYNAADIVLDQFVLGSWVNQYSRSYELSKTRAHVLQRALYIQSFRSKTTDFKLFL